MAVAYTQAEADRLIAVPKWVDRGAWEGRERIASKTNNRLKVSPDDDLEGLLTFGLLISTNDLTEGISEQPSATVVRM